MPELPTSGGGAAIAWRSYQRHATNAAVAEIKTGVAALLVLPTGAGKSLNAAEAARRAHVAGLRTVILAPTRELVEQDARAVAIVAGGSIAPSIACAGLGRVELDGSIVIGTPQTVVRRLDELGRIDLAIVDEAHRVGRSGSGQLNQIITTLRERNHALMLFGLTATPFRLDSGRLTEGDDRIFEKIAFEAEYLDLVKQGYLAPLIGPRDTIERLDVTGLRIERGDYAASGLARFDRTELTERIADQIVAHGDDRKSWLAFAVNVEHAGHLAEALVSRGVDARLLTGRTPSAERAGLVADFKAGAVRCLVGCDVFSTGFDAPAVDLIAIVRPTCSPVWHVQSAGRGTRIAPDKRDCLILDFAHNFARLGPIDAPVVRANGERVADGAVRTRCCPSCDAINALSATVCGVCNTPFPQEQPSGEYHPRRTDRLSTSAAGSAVITGAGILPVLFTRYIVHRKDGRPDSLRIIHRVSGFSFPTVSEWLCCWHDGHAGRQGRDEWRARLLPGACDAIPDDATAAAQVAPSRLRDPSRVRVAHEGDFIRTTPLFDPP